MWPILLFLYGHCLISGWTEDRCYHGNKSSCSGFGWKFWCVGGIVQYIWLCCEEHTTKRGSLEVRAIISLSRRVLFEWQLIFSAIIAGFFTGGSLAVRGTSLHLRRLTLPPSLPLIFVAILLTIRRTKVNEKLGYRLCMSSSCLWRCWNRNATNVCRTPYGTVLRTQYLIPGARVSSHTSPGVNYIPLGSHLIFKVICSWCYLVEFVFGCTIIGIAMQTK